MVGRGGSKGVPRKNLRQLAGLSLIGFKALAARRATSCSRLVISTEDPEIQDEARRHGVEVPFVRPAHLASDTASSEDVVRHAIDWFETVEGRSYDAIMLLEPSSPFARSADFDAAVALYVARAASLVVGMREAEVNPLFVGPVTSDGSISAIVDNILSLRSTRRQAVGRAWTMNGALYLFGWEEFKQTGRIYSDPARSFGLEMDRYHSVEIEGPADLSYAEWVVENEKIDLADWRAALRPAGG
ncbi:MAG: acylneuraminate cytidylyltransferase family protein [Pseudomonadota bacterium]